MSPSKCCTMFVLSLFTLVSSTSVFAEPTESLLKSFVKAMSDAKQPTTTQSDIAQYLSYMTDDFTDLHAAYNVTQSGKAKAMENMLKKVETNKSFSHELSEFILGTDTAIMVINEESSYIKKGKLKHFKGRTLWVLEFNEHDKIKHMRRYLD